MNRAVFLDRDGVINWKAPEGRYISSKSELILLPGVRAAVRRLHDAGFLVFIATNQRGVARRRVSPEVLDGIHQYLLDVFFDALAPITKIYVCPHEGGCECRKPAPGMLLRAAEEHAIDLHASWVVGDSVTDIEAGKRAGCRTTWIRDGMTQQVSGVRPDLEAKDLRDAVKLILKATKRSAQGKGRSQRDDLSRR